MRSRPSTGSGSLGAGGRATDAVLDLGLRTAPAAGRTPFPSMYRPAPDTLSGARIRAREGLDAAGTGRALPRTSGVADGVGPALIAERYSRRGALEADRARGTDLGRAPLDGLRSSGGPSLSRARLDAARARADRSRSEQALRGTAGTPSVRAGAPRVAEARPGRDLDSGRDWQAMRRRYDEAKRSDPGRVAAVDRASEAAGIATDVALRTAFTATKAVTGIVAHPSIAGGWSGNFAHGGSHGHGGHHHHTSHVTAWFWWSWYPSFCWSWYGHGWWWWNSCWAPGFYYRPYFASYWYRPYYPYWGYYSYPAAYYAYSPPVVYTTIYQGEGYAADSSEASVYAEGQEAGAYAEPTVDGRVPATPRATQHGEADGPLSGRATAEYLSLGDRAFVEGRYGRAVQYYAKAVEYSPQDGVLYLILSDALFATGDYHYAAYALRRALELAPELAQGAVDKRNYYGDRADFDRQLVQLERYLSDHFQDDDARLVLAANYLFGGMPERCSELLDSPFSIEVRESEAGALLLEGARAAVAAKR